ncbi:MAG: DNA/RNA non-specific endonuclease [Cyanobacteria bacterium P01_F01_bin.33]
MRNRHQLRRLLSMLPPRYRGPASVAIALLAGALYVFQACLGPQVPSGSGGHLAAGNPSQAGSDPNNYLMEKPQYALSYNRSRGTANWVSWQLNSSWLGQAERQDDFRPDETLPATWERVRHGDYTGSGFDRGHLVPSADRTRSEADNSATFLMTNIVPQTAANNRGPWKELEEYARELVEQGKELYVVAGVYGDGKRINEGKVTAPTHVWKVILVLDRPSVGLDSVTERTRTIAIDMPNRESLKPDWQDYIVTVDDIERSTQYDLFSNLPVSVQEAIERQRDRG